MKVGVGVGGLLSLSPAEGRVGAGSLPALMPQTYTLSLGSELEQYCPQCG